MKTFNKRGDSGETSLLHGARVPKNHLRCEAYGTIDEAVSALGLARALCKRVPRETIAELQRALFTAGGELATSKEHISKLTSSNCNVTAAMADDLEKQIEDLERTVEMPKAFVLPGAEAGAAALDLARATLRRAERRIVDLVQAGEVSNPELEKFVNRMADLLFTLARYEEDDGSRQPQE